MEEMSAVILSWLTCIHTSGLHLQFSELPCMTHADTRWHTLTCCCRMSWQYWSLFTVWWKPWTDTLAMWWVLWNKIDVKCWDSPLSGVRWTSASHNGGIETCHLWLAPVNLAEVTWLSIADTHRRISELYQHLWNWVKRTLESSFFVEFSALHFPTYMQFDHDLALANVGESIRT